MNKVAFLFPGQGAQTVGMGRELFETVAPAREIFEKANEILGYDIGEICFNGPEDELNSTVHSQPAIFVASIAALEKLKIEQGDAVENCAGTAGLSLGEYTSLVFAGCIDFEDGLKLVQRRGQAMQQAADIVESTMFSILGLELSNVEAICEEVRDEGEVCQVANILCPGNIVISGHTDVCNRAAKLASENGAMKTIQLAVAGAFHTSLMQPAVDQLSAALVDVKFSEPRIPVYSNVDAKTHTDPEEIKRLLTEQVVSPVLWEASMRAMLENEFDQFFEVGPGRTLCGLLKRINRKIPCAGVMG